MGVTEASRMERCSHRRKQEPEQRAVGKRFLTFLLSSRHLPQTLPAKYLKLKPESPGSVPLTQGRGQGRGRGSGSSRVGTCKAPSQVTNKE